MSSPLDYSRFAPPEHEEPWNHTFTVEVHTGIKENRGWDLWGENMLWKQVEEECRILKARGFDYRIRDERGIEWNL